MMFFLMEIYDVNSKKKEEKKQYLLNFVNSEILLSCWEFKLFGTPEV